MPATDLQAPASISSDDVAQGRILWLPPKSKVLSTYLQRTDYGVTPVIRHSSLGAANDGLYNHPILVLSRPAQNPDRIYFLVITSFRGQTVSQALQYGDTRQPSWFLPIAPQQHPHPLHSTGDLDYRTLSLVGALHMAKSSYVNVKEVYIMDWRDARLYWGSNPALTRAHGLAPSSLARLLRVSRLLSGYGPGLQHGDPCAVSGDMPHQPAIDVASAAMSGDSAPLLARLAHLSETQPVQPSYQTIIEPERRAQVPSRAAYFPADLGVRYRQQNQRDADTYVRARLRRRRDCEACGVMVVVLCWVLIVAGALYWGLASSRRGTESDD